LHGSSVLEHGYLLNTDISQGSVATCWRCGRIFNKFIANLITSLSLRGGALLQTLF